RDVPRHLPARRNGRRLHISAVYRWMSRGVRGIILESVRLGGTAYTSCEALQRFADAVGRSRSRGEQRSPTSLTRQRQLDQAQRRLDDELNAKP
ncbi:MAG TPA: DUF1580 domain-containing protein, partial [Gammaproteobacteria bacterium]|nr:DUF1580 domain-containing protein [Gammaproteobacteria bacterium]